MSKVVSMDARKFVKFINESAQSQLASLQRCVCAMGNKVNKQYELIAAHRTSLLFEDKEANKCNIADYRYGKNRRIVISNIRPIQITESRKEHVFNNACVELVNNISEDKHKEAEAIFRKLEGCRFRSTVANEDGYVTTKDGRRRKIYEAVEETQDHVDIVDVVCEHVLGDNVVVGDDGIVSAIFDDGQVMQLPSIEPIKRRMVAEEMKHTANESYKSPRFQLFVRSVASMISNDHLQDAIVESAKFMKEYQEFCMLNLNEMVDLVDKTLAVQNVYNHLLVEDAALLIYKANLKVNKDDIVEAWEKVAKSTANATLLENVDAMAKAENFGDHYDTFLQVVLNEEKEYDDIVRNYIDMILQRMKEIKETREDQDERFDRAYEKLSELYHNANDPATADEGTMETLYDIASKLAERKGGGLGDAELGNFDIEAVDTQGLNDKDIGFVSDYLNSDDEEEQKGEASEGESESVSGGLNLGGLGAGGEEPDLGGEGGEDLGLGEEGEEGGEEGEENKEGEEELDKLLAAGKDKSNIQVLEDEYKRLSGSLDEMLSKYGRDYVVNKIGEYAVKCESLDNEILAESFRSLVANTDPYGDFMVTEQDVIGVNSAYGYKESEDDETAEEDDTVNEAQRKSATSAHKRSRPDASKRSLMKEDAAEAETEEGSDEDTEEGADQSGDENVVDEGVTVVAVSADSTDDLDAFSSAINQVFGDITNDDLNAVIVDEGEGEDENEGEDESDENQETVEESIDYGVDNKDNTPKGHNNKSKDTPKNSKPKVKKDDNLGNEAGKLKKTKTGQNVVESRKQGKKPTFGFGPFKETKKSK